MSACGCSNGAQFASRAKSRIEIQSSNTTDDDYGGREDNWKTRYTIWAVIEPTSGKEIFTNDQLQSRVDARILIRYQPALADTTATAEMRVLFGSRLYNIRAVHNLDDDLKTEGVSFQRLLCTEGEPS
jgi:SPP1 family predicted phage head-tail adaptor